MAEKNEFHGEKIEFQGKKSSFELFGKIEFPSKRTKKSLRGQVLFFVMSAFNLEDLQVGTIALTHVNLKEALRLLKDLSQLFVTILWLDKNSLLIALGQESSFCSLGLRSSIRI